MTLMSAMHEASTLITSAITELVREHYVVRVTAQQGEEFLVTWDDSAGKNWGFWGSRALLEALFTEAVFH